MAKGIFTGIDDKARKAKKLYIGVDGKARKVKKAYIGVDGVARLFYSSGWVLGSEALSGSSSGQTSAISGYDAYTFNADTGVVALSGAKSSHSLATLHSSGNPVYTAVSSDGHKLTLKRVTDKKSTTTDGYYSEGSTSSSSSWYDEGKYLSGKSSYSFNKSTGQYTVSGSKSGYVEDLYGTSTKIYISGGSTLKWYEVTDKSTSTSTNTTYSEGSMSWGSWQEEAEWNGSPYGSGITISGYSGYSFSSSSGYYTTGSYFSYTLYEGDSGDYTVYDVSSDGKNLYATQLQASDSYCRARSGSAGARTSTSTTTTTDYKVTTYTRGTTYTAPTSTTTYTVATYTRSAAEE